MVGSRSVAPFASMLIVAASVAVGCHFSSERPTARRGSAPQTGFLVINGLRLQYLDWGGSGTPLVLIAGGGDSPHIFDDLAPHLTERHRVVSFARRGHGQSEVPTAPFTVDDLADDLRQVLDSLGIGHAVLLGFSFGGNEITRFAERFPDRVLKLVYLDATFDWSTPSAAAVWEQAPFYEGPTAADRASVDNFRRYQQRMWWFADVPWSPTVEVVFQDRIRVAADGSVSVPVDQVVPSLVAINKNYRRPYPMLKQPTLVLLAEYYIPPSVARDAASAALQAKWHTETFLPVQQAIIDQLSREMVDVRVIRLPGVGHGAVTYLHLEHLASTIREFTVAASFGR